MQHIYPMKNKTVFTCYLMARKASANRAFHNQSAIIEERKSPAGWDESPIQSSILFPQGPTRCLGKTYKQDMGTTALFHCLWEEKNRRAYVRSPSTKNSEGRGTWSRSSDENIREGQAQITIASPSDMLIQSHICALYNHYICYFTISSVGLIDVSMGLSTTNAAQEKRQIVQKPITKARILTLLFLPTSMHILCTTKPH